VWTVAQVADFLRFVDSRGLAPLRQWHRMRKLSGTPRDPPS
jgi:hypothetical protein